ncbi:MAG: hypothetical protein M1138_07015, partial [Candidatus Thermoplasmatota archaeon]|nr:hypothetical protein [Candidatus Thermoplasmatota archaeon]
HAWFHDNFMMSVKLYVSIFWSILMDLVSNLTVNLDHFYSGENAQKSTGDYKDRNDPVIHQFL